MGEYEDTLEEIYLERARYLLNTGDCLNKVCAILMMGGINYGKVYHNL